MKDTVLVLGATGGIGGEVARQLNAAGWGVRAMARSVPSDAGDGIDWRRGDAMKANEVLAAAQNCTVIVHAVNPPGYKRWGELAVPMLDNTIAAAERTGATIVLPGNIYNYGENAFPSIAEEAPQKPASRKGAVRVAMEQRLLDFAERGGRVLIVRAGDFFGPHAGNNWFSQGLVKAGRPVTRIDNPGPGVGHQWAYLPDVARTIVQLLAMREKLEPFAHFHFGGHWDADGTQMADAIQKAVAGYGGTRPSISRFPWWLVRLASPFVETFREMLEMRYLWQQPVRMDNRRLLSVLGHEPHTPLDEAVEATLVGLGCISSTRPVEGTRVQAAS